MAETLSVTDMLPNKFQPKMTNWWILSIEGIDSFLLKKAARPSYTTESVEIPWINTTRYLAGKTKFEEMSLTLYDPIAPSGAQQVMEWIRLCYESVSGRSGYSDFYKRDIALKMIDPVGTIIEYWDIKGAFVIKANFGDIDMEKQEPQMIEISIRFDNACLQF